MKPLIVKIAEERFNSKVNNQIVHLVDDEEENIFLNDLKNIPHAFVLACLMDRRVNSERAWRIPYQIYKILGTFDIHELGKISLEDYIRIFEENKLHWYNKDQALVFYKAIHRIIDVYDGDVSKIWKGTPSSAKVVYEFLQFYGCGIKIATMTANILVRQFKIKFSDYYSLDISPDIHIKKVMKRMGLVPKNADATMIIYKARELNPEFPGIIDFSCWEIGRTYCHKTNPDCKNCIVGKECEKSQRNGM